LELNDFRIAFVVVSLILALIAASPALSLISLPSSEEHFSELWILGPGHKVEDYPFNVRVNEQYSIFVGVGNQLGELAYYAVYVKLRNQTQRLPNVKTSEPSPLNSTYEFVFFLADGKTCEIPLIFSFQGEPTLISNILINDVVFPVNCFSIWDSDRNGFYYQMFFELWLYNMTIRNFQYHNRFVGIWLNVTST